MSKRHYILTRNQWIGIGLILILLGLIFVGLHFLPAPPDKPHYSKADSLKKGRIHRGKQYYDSLRAVRTARYDSLRLVRRDSLHHVYVAHRDSVRKVDSLWWDSVYQSTPRPIKKDTILELNHADTTELKLIRGIGSNMARRIVRYRNQLGGFVSVKQLQDDGLYQDQYGHSIRSKYYLQDSVLSAFIVDSDSIHKIPVNHASVERLQGHPYISYSLAKEIYTLRRKQVTIKSIDELKALPLVSDSVLQLLTPYLSFEK